MENYQNPQVPQQAPVAPAEAQLPQANKKGFDVKKLIPVVAVAVVVAIVIGLFAGGGYKKPVKEFFEIVYEGKASKIKNMVPKDVVDDEDMEELIEKYQEMYDEKVEENGKTKYDYKITDSEKLDKDDDEFEMIAKSAESWFEVDEDDVKQVYEIEVEVTAETDDDEIEEELTLYSAKIGGKWYLFIADGICLPAYAVIGLAMADF